MIGLDIPIVLFAYARPDHLRRTLECLRINEVPLLYTFSDGPRSPDKESAVAEVRVILRAIDWCEVVLCERDTNLGLGHSILTGVTEVLSKHEAVMVFEDDLICVPGTYQYLCAALNHYRHDSEVMSVTGWTHPSTTPSDITDQPYFDGRAECWVWGTWARAWRGMERDAKTLMQECARKGIDVYRYGADLPAMAEVELERNIWAVRFLYHHVSQGGLCLRPPWSMVEHIGFDAQATNASYGSALINPPLKLCPPIPDEWPANIEHAACAALWQKSVGSKPIQSPPLNLHRRGTRVIRRVAARITRSPGFETMSAKEFVKLLTPPLFIKLAKRALAVQHAPVAEKSTHVPLIEWEYIPEGWTYARTHPEVKGWNVQDVLETYKRKWDKFVAMAKGTGPLGMSHESELVTNEDIFSHNTVMAFGYAIVLAARHKDTLSMLDWGGGIGHYYVLAKALLPEVTIDYHCKDVPVLADYGAQLFPDQYFYPDGSCLNRTYDFVMASTSLHYAEDWQEVLAGLARATGGYLYVTRLPTVTQSASYVFIQRPYAYGYNTEYLGWCLNRDAFLEEARELGLKLVREFVISEYPPIVNAPGACQYRGFLFQQERASGDR